MRWWLYGEVYFTTNQKRNTASNRLNNMASQRGFVAAAWSGYPAGRANITGLSDAGANIPGLRFCYYTTTEQNVRDADADIIAFWDYFADSPSWWSWTADPSG